MRPYLKQCAHLFAFAAGFSLVINVLLLASPIFMLQVYDRVLTSRSVETLIALTVITAVALAALSWLDSLRLRLLGRAAVKLEATAFGSAFRRSVASASRAGGPYRHAFRDLRSIRNFLSGAGFLAFLDMPWCPVFVLIIGLFHPAMGTLALAGVVALLLLAWLDDRLSRSAVESASEASRRAGEFGDEVLRNADAVKAMGMLSCVEQRASAGNEAAATQYLSASRSSSRVLAVSKMLRQDLQVLMLALGAYLVLRQSVSAGVMIAATLLLSRAMAPIESAISGWRSMIEARSALRRLNAFLSGDDAARPMPLPAPLGSLAADRVFYAVDRDTVILKGISLQVEPGELLGLIGPSGAGKTMLGRVLVGVLSPTAGAVRLDGADLKHWDGEQLGAHIGYLPQDVQLFDGTVAENIARLRDPAAEHERIIEAAQLAGVHERILRLPQAYDTRVGALGFLLSAGQRQLIGLARALFGDPRLVVLDEPNSNLDSEGELALLKALSELRQRRITTVLITHRPSILRDATTVLVLRAGSVVEYGPKDEVLGKVAQVSPLQPTLVHSAS